MNGLLPWKEDDLDLVAEVTREILTVWLNRYVTATKFRLAIHHSYSLSMGKKGTPHCGLPMALRFIKFMCCTHNGGNSNSPPSPSLSLCLSHLSISRPGLSEGVSGGIGCVCQVSSPETKQPLG